MVGTSMVKGIKVNKVNKQLRNSFAKRRSFPGATLKHLKYCVVPSLVGETPDRITMYGKCNDINNKNLTPEKIANKIGDIAILYPGYGLNDVLMSAMICRRSKFLNKKVKSMNFLLKIICEENWYFFIDNSNIEIKDLERWYTSVRIRKY